MPHPGKRDLDRRASAGPAFYFEVAGVQLHQARRQWESKTSPFIFPAAAVQTVSLQREITSSLTVGALRRLRLVQRSESDTIVNL